jgi:hypothetical protein
MGNTSNPNEFPGNTTLFFHDRSLGSSKQPIMVILNLYAVISLGLLLLFTSDSVGFWGEATRASQTGGKAEAPIVPLELGQTCAEGTLMVHTDRNKTEISAGEDVPLQITTYFPGSRAPGVPVSVGAGAGFFVEGGGPVLKGMTDNNGELRATWRTPSYAEFAAGGARHGSALYALDVTAFDLSQRTCAVQLKVKVSW